MNSRRILIFAQESQTVQELKNGLITRGFYCTLTSREEELMNSEPADLLLIEIRNDIIDPGLKEITLRIKQDRHISIILLANREVLRDMDSDPNIDDFVLEPYNLDELSVRIKRLLKKNTPVKESTDILRSGDLVIDLPRCEVWVKGKVVDLTYTEYELLKYLVSKKGQVLTREALLNKIWGYEYIGGDRTVDVHITRLRSKIEDPYHSFIETVRNIGYRLKTDDK